MGMVSAFVTGMEQLNRHKYNFRIFIIEGAITVGVALLAYFVVPTWSHKAKFVSLHTHHIIPFD